jgi:hypothetical protein
MRAITGRGCDKSNAPNRQDQPMHDQTGGNYWIFPLVQYQDQEGTLRLGGGLSTEQIEAMDDGTLRAKTHLTQAATLDVDGDTARITNMTGHKVISGYPEGRRMWLNIKFYDDQGNLVEEIGEWGPLPTTAINPRDGSTFVPWSIVDLDNPKLKVYEVHPAMNKEWADVLLAVGYPPNMPLSFDRLSGQPDFTLEDLSALPAGGYHETFHFALNNYVAFDNRIPPYQMDYDESLRRNAQPVPANQYGGSPGGFYNHWDEHDIAALAPNNAAYADLTLYYQGTSWEYVQFLNNAVSNKPTGAGAPTPVTEFLAEEGQNFLDAWLNAPDINGNTMVPPFAMATATWNNDDSCIPEPEICDNGADDDCDGLVDCADSDCDGTPECPNLIEWPMCFDGVDNDFDGLTDCDDRTDCDGYSEDVSCGIGACENDGTEACNNGTYEYVCTPLPATEPSKELTCDNGLDDDCDGFTDCDDSDCDADPACQMNCEVYSDRGLCNDDPNCEWVGNSKRGSCQEITVCVPTGPESGFCGDGIDNDCNGLTDCDDVDACGSDPVCEGCVPEPEICDDGIDNDCDGLTDANDSDCQDCSVYTNRKECRAATCDWSNKTGMCTNP